LCANFLHRASDRVGAARLLRQTFESNIRDLRCALHFGDSPWLVMAAAIQFWADIGPLGRGRAPRKQGPAGQLMEASMTSCKPQSLVFSSKGANAGCFTWIVSVVQEKTLSRYGRAIGSARWPLPRGFFESGDCSNLRGEDLLHLLDGILPDEFVFQVFLIGWRASHGEPSIRGGAARRENTGRLGGVVLLFAFDAIISKVKQREKDQGDHLGRGGIKPAGTKHKRRLFRSWGKGFGHTMVERYSVEQGWGPSS